MSNPQLLPVVAFAGGALAGAAVALIPLVAAELLRRRYRKSSHRTANVAHQLKSPIGVMISASDTLHELATSTAPDAATVDTYLRMLKKNVIRLESFVGNLRKVVSIQGGAVELRLTSVMPSDLINASLEGLAVMAKAKGLLLRTQVNAKRAVTVDPDKAGEVLSNLVMNAIAYSERGEITVMADERGADLVVSICDQGRGLSAAQRRQIFSRFYRGGYSEGTGLGLAIAKGWVEAHGGRIGAASEGRGKGSCFWFELPFAR